MLEYFFYMHIYSYMYFFLKVQNRLDRLTLFKHRVNSQNACNTSGVFNPKICRVIICIAYHLCVSENFDMHSLKQVYFYDYMC